MKGQLNNESRNSHSHSAKRQRFSSTIRKQFMQQLFDQQRAVFRMENQNRLERQINNSKIVELLNQYKQNPCEQTINNLYSMFTVQNCDIDLTLKMNCTQLIKMVLQFPQNINCALICRMTINRVYSQIFLQQQKIYKGQRQNKANNSIDFSQLYDSQRVIVFLYQTVDKKIGEYMENQNQNYNIDKIQINNSGSNINRLQKINTKNLIRIYIQCLKEIVCHNNTFALHPQFGKKYFQNWLKVMFLTNTDLFFNGFLIYSAYMTLEQHLPFNSFRIQQFNKSEKQAQEKELTIFDRLFKLAVPQKFTNKVQEVVVYSTIFIYNILQNDSLSIGMLLQYSQQIFNLTRLIFNHPNTYSSKVKYRAFQFLMYFSQRITQQDKKTSQPQLQQKLSKYNLIESFTSVNFISLFKIYLIMETSQTKLYVYLTLLNCLEFTISRRLSLRQLFDDQTLYYIVVGISQTGLIQISKVCLKLIVSLCSYAIKNQQLVYKAKMIEFGIEEYLQNLVYHKDQYIATLAQQLLEFDFSQQERYKCTALRNELKRYQEQDESIPDRNQVYE